MNGEQICFVNCGLPGDLCACYRAQMQRVYADIWRGQMPLEHDFSKVWNDNIEELYEQ